MRSRLPIVTREQGNNRIGCICIYIERESHRGFARITEGLQIIRIRSLLNQVKCRVYVRVSVCVCVYVYVQRVIVTRLHPSERLEKVSLSLSLFLFLYSGLNGITSAQHGRVRSTRCIDARTIHPCSRGDGQTDDDDGRWFLFNYYRLYTPVRARSVYTRACVHRGTIGLCE